MINYDLSKIRAIFFDVDGVLSTQTITLASSGEPLRSANIKDGYAIQLAQKQGLIMGIITGGKTNAVKVRYENLGVKDIFMLRHQKLETFLKYQKEKHLKREQILYMGDDMPDIPPMKRAGLAICPVDAVPEVRAVSDYISHLEGGQGAVRDIIEQVLKVRGDWTFEDK